MSSVIIIVYQTFVIHNKVSYKIDIIAALRKANPCSTVVFEFSIFDLKYVLSPT